jgi:hypothetical protein
MRGLALLATVVAASASAAYTQDPVTVDSKHYSVEFENDYVRVLRIKYGPGEKSVMHEHPDAVAIMLTDGTINMILRDNGARAPLDARNGGLEARRHARAGERRSGHPGRARALAATN